MIIQLRYEPHGYFKIPATCFFPQPDVDSACVTLVRRTQPLLTAQQSQAFTKIFKRAFSQRRKMMFKLLKEDWPVEKLEQAFEQANIFQKDRAESISLEKLGHLSQWLLR